MGDPNCYTCSYCLDSCFVCPTDVQRVQISKYNRKRIWKQSRMSASQGLLKKQSLLISQMVGQSACPPFLGQAGGPGDLQSAIQSQTPCGKGCNYNIGRVRGRTAYNNKSGVDRKHGSYQRYLARKVGGVFRKEVMPNIVGRTSWRGQPRTRTGTSACCKRPTHSKVCEAICAQATIVVAKEGNIYGYNVNGNTPLPTALVVSCEDLTNLTRLTWTDNPGQGLDTFIVNFSQSITFSSIIIWDTNGNSITYQRGDGNTVDNETTTWTHQDTPTWIDTGVTIEVTLDGPCCNNRIPKCGPQPNPQANFTGLNGQPGVTVAGGRCNCCGQ